MFRLGIAFSSLQGYPASSKFFFCRGSNPEIARAYVFLTCTPKFGINLFSFFLGPPTPIIFVRSDSTFVPLHLWERKRQMELERFLKRSREFLS